MIKQTYTVLYGEFENEKKKDKKKFDLQERGFEPQIFSNFPALDLNFRVIRTNLLSLLKSFRLYYK
jgi:hypothetical protein